MFFKYVSRFFSVVFAFLLLIIILQLQQQYGRVKVKQTFPESVNIKNNTFYSIDTITKVLVNKVLKYDTLNVLITYVVDESPYPNPDLWIQAFVIKHPNIPKTYMIFMSSKLEDYEIPEVICHEFAHIEQFETNRLQVINQERGWYLWENKATNLAQIPYKYRIHEKDARERGDILYEKLYDELYFKKKP